MSSNFAAVERNRGAIHRWMARILLGAATAVLIGSLFSQGMGGTLTTVAKDPLAGASLIVLLGVPMLASIMLVKYRRYGLSMFSMGARREETTTIFALVRGGYTMDAVVLRWIWVVILGLTSLGINIGISEADRTIGTGPRTAFMVLCTAMAGVSVLVASGLWNQVVMRAVLILGVGSAVALTSSSGQVAPSGLMWAAVVGLHMFAVQKGLTAFGTTADADEETNKRLSQRYRDIGMLLANSITFFLMLAYATWKHALPTADQFEGSALPLLVLYLAVPGLIMVIPILGMNWARNRLSETSQAMWTSTAPVWGALAALTLGFIGWANPPQLDASQWVGIFVVVLAAVGAGIDVASHERRTKVIGEKDEALAHLRAALELAKSEHGQEAGQGVAVRKGDDGQEHPSAPVGEVYGQPSGPLVDPKPLWPRPAGGLPTEPAWVNAQRVPAAGEFSVTSEGTAKLTAEGVLFPDGSGFNYRKGNLSVEIASVGGGTHGNGSFTGSWATGISAVVDGTEMSIPSTGEFRVDLNDGTLFLAGITIRPGGVTVAE
ncbi:hypothetical protein ACIBI3_22880 [Actinomadura luteofluorescens]|uniref:hypothetical protein n=1 Tax=Actinomadura luteofluorescens TaxID=46163 RepID=UPI0034891033